MLTSNEKKIEKLTKSTQVLLKVIFLRLQSNYESFYDGLLRCDECEHRDEIFEVSFVLQF